MSRTKKEEEKPACNICMEPYTKQVHRKPVSCAQCSETACVRCLKTHITTSIEDPHCPSCRKAWTYDYICQLFPKTWYNGEFKQRRQEILMDRERSRLPEAQAWAERMRRGVHEYRPLIQKSRADLVVIKNDVATTKCERELYKREYGHRKNKTKEDKKEYNQKIKEWSDKMTSLRIRETTVYNELARSARIYDALMNQTDEQIQSNENYERFLQQVRAENPGIDRHMEQALVQSLMATVDLKAKAPGRVFTMKCPGAECRGFLSTGYKCGICERCTCAHCLIQYPIDDPQGEAHTCSEDDKKTVELIKKSCRNCPSCGMSIFRIEGCNQMFCTACNTAFDWATGQQLNTRQIHNPHYTDYLRRVDLGSASASASAHNHNHNPCGEDDRIDYHDFSRRYIIPFEMATGSLKEANPELYGPKVKDIAHLYGHIREGMRLMNHIRAVEIFNLRADLRRITTNQKLNAEYLINTYSVSQWKKQIMANEVKRLAYNEALQGVQAFLDVCTILYQNFGHEYTNTLQTVPKDIYKYVHPIGFLTHSERRNYATQRERIEENYNVLLEHMKTLWAQVEQMIEIMNEKIMTIVKTYKVQLNIYRKDVTQNHRGELYTYFHSRKVSYTSLYGTQRKRTPIEQRPVPGLVSASASAISESEETSTIGEEEGEREPVNSLLEEIEKLMRETPEPETDSDAESTDSE
jgi:hypothetical protein